jgi:hypothetical protein
MTMLPPLEAADVKLLLELAFVAAGRGAVDDTDALAAGLLASRPHLAGPSVARALARMNRGQHDEAVALLERTLPTDASERAQHQAFLGLALQLGGRSAESRRVLQAVADHPDAGIARAMLGRPALTPAAAAGAPP